MLKQLSTTVLGLLLCGIGANPAIAETVMEKIARTGDLTIGVNLNNVPFSYINDKDEVVGYSLDIADRIRAEVAKELGKDVILQVVETPDVKDAIPRLRSGEIDIVCDTAFTWERDRYVDFTASYAVTGMQLLVPENSSIEGATSLKDKKIAYVPNTVTEDAIKLVRSRSENDRAELVPMESLQAGLEALADGTVDGVAGDGLLMDGLRQVLGIEEMRLVPESPEISYGVGCMVRQNNSSFLRLANYALIKLAEGYYYGDSEDVKLVNQWLGPDGVVKLDPKAIKAFFNYLLVTHEQIPEKLQSD